MFKIFLRNTVLALLYLSIYSCTFIKPTPDSLNSDIDYWLSQNQYGKIDYAIKKLEAEKKPDFQIVLKRKQSLAAKKSAYIEKTLRKARKLKSDFKWQQALEVYDTALSKIINQPKLLKERNELISQRNRHVTDLRKDLLINRANALISYDKTYSALQQLIPEDRNAKNDIDQYENEKEELASELQKCGEHAIKNNHYAVARDCYVLSNKLKPSETKSSFVDTIKKQLKSQEDEHRFKELFSEYKTAYNRKDYRRARTALQTITAIEPKHKNANQLLAALNNEVNEIVEGLISTGKKQYSKKEIEQALKSWKKAEKLNPANKELTQLISRAEKISKKLQKLESSQ